MASTAFEDEEALVLPESFGLDEIITTTLKDDASSRLDTLERLFRTVVRDMRTVWLLERAFEGRVKSTVRGWRTDFENAKQEAVTVLQRQTEAAAAVAGAATSEAVARHEHALASRLSQMKHEAHEARQLALSTAHEVNSVFAQRLGALEARAHITEDRIEADAAIQAARADINSQRVTTLELRLRELESALQHQVHAIDQIRQRAEPAIVAVDHMVLAFRALGNDDDFAQAVRDLVKRLHDSEVARCELTDKMAELKRTVAATADATEDILSTKLEKRMHGIEVCVDTHRAGVDKRLTEISTAADAGRSRTTALHNALQIAGQRIDALEATDAARKLSDTMTGLADVQSKLASLVHDSFQCQADLTHLRSTKADVTAITNIATKSDLEPKAETKDLEMVQRDFSSISALVQSLVERTTRHESVAQLTTSTSQKLDALIAELRRTTTSAAAHASRPVDSQQGRKPSLQDTAPAPAPDATADSSLIATLPSSIFALTNAVPAAVALHRHRRKWNASSLASTSSEQFKKPPRKLPSVLADSLRLAIQAQQMHTPDDEQWRALRQRQQHAGPERIRT